MKPCISEERDLIIQLREEAFRRQDGLCFWCRKPMIVKDGTVRHDDHRLCTADHVVWRSRGGKSTQDNIVAACFGCNTSRHPPPTESDWPWFDRLVASRIRDVGWGPW